MLRGVDQIDIWHPERLLSPHRITPQRCPDAVAVTVQPAASASRRASSISFFGCLALAVLTRYNKRPRVGHAVNQWNDPTRRIRRLACIHRADADPADWGGECRPLALAQHDTETRFRALAARGSLEEGLRVLDKLDAALGARTSPRSGTSSRESSCPMRS